MTDNTSTPAPPPPTEVGVVLPNDNRQVVPNSSTAPFWWIGQVETTWSNGAVSRGTGVLFGELHVLTCAHNFIDRRGATAISSRFTMGLNQGAPGGAQPGVAVALAAYQAPPQYRSAGGPPPPPGGVPPTEVTHYLYDIAIARLNRMSVPEPPGESHFVLGPLPKTPVPSRLIGYSGDLDPQASTQYDRSGNSSLGQDFLTYTMSTSNGDSGAPVFYPDPARPFYRVIGVHVSGVRNNWNFAVPLTQSYIDLVDDLINQVDSGQGAPLR